MRVEVAPPGGDLLLQGGDAVVVAAGKDRGGRDGGGHLGFPPRRAALPPVSHAEPVRVIPASTPACIHARDDRRTSRCPSSPAPSPSRTCTPPAAPPSPFRGCPIHPHGKASG